MANNIKYKVLSHKCGIKTCKTFENLEITSDLAVRVYSEKDDGLERHLMIKLKFGCPKGKKIKRVLLEGKEIDAIHYGFFNVKEFRDLSMFSKIMAMLRSQKESFEDGIFYISVENVKDFSDGILKIRVIYEVELKNNNEKFLGLCVNSLKLKKSLSKQLITFNQNWIPQFSPFNGHVDQEIEINCPSNNTVFCTGEVVSIETAKKSGNKRKFSLEGRNSKISGKIGKKRDEESLENCGLDVLSKFPLASNVFRFKLSTTAKESQGIFLFVGEFKNFVIRYGDSELIFHYPKEIIIEKKMFEFTIRALEIYEKFTCDSFPLDKCNIVFVYSPVEKIKVVDRNLFVDLSYLHNDKEIENVYRTRRAISYGLARLWIFKSIGVLSPADEWITEAFSRYLSSLFEAEEFGKSFLEYRKAKQRFNWATTRIPLVCLSGKKNKIFSDRLLHFKLKEVSNKSLSVIQILESILGGVEFKSFVKGFFINTKNGDKVSTKTLEKEISKFVSSRRIKEVFDLFVRSDLNPVYLIDYSYNNQKREVYLKVANVSNAVMNRHDDFSKCISKPFALLRETQEGEHRICLEKWDNVYEISGDANVSKFKIRLKNLSGKSSQPGKKAGLQWLRIDPFYEWLFSAKLKVDDISQAMNMLSTNAGIKANLEGLSAVTNLELSGSNSFQASQLLLAALKNRSLFFKVRAVAAQRLVAMAEQNRSVFVRVIESLLAFFRDEFYTAEKFVSKNRFNDFAQYFLKKRLVKIISGVRDSFGFTFQPIVLFIVELLNFNDNAENYFSDDKYLCTVIKSAGNLKLQFNEQLMISVFEQLERYLRIDKLFPSNNKCVTGAVLEAFSRLERNKQLEKREIKYLDYFSNNHLKKNVIEAVSNLFLTDREKYLNFLIDVFATHEISHERRLKLMTVLYKNLKEIKLQNIKLNSPGLGIDSSKNVTGAKFLVDNIDLNLLKDLSVRENKRLHSFLIESFTLG